MELMIVVAIVAILAAIAYPSFMEQVRSSRRSEALATMGSMQLALERWRADNPSFAYAATGSGTHPFAGGAVSRDHYSFSLTASDPTTYTLVASPLAGKAQVGDRCGNLTAQLTAGANVVKPLWATASCNR